MLTSWIIGFHLKPISSGAECWLSNKYLARPEWVFLMRKPLHYGRNGINLVSIYYGYTLGLIYTAAVTVEEKYHENCQKFIKYHPQKNGKTISFFKLFSTIF